MVIAALRGGLGNQMFQYAAGRAAARAGGVPLVLDTVYLNDRFPRPAFSPRTYDLDIFNVVAPLTSLSKLSASFPIPGIWLGIDLAVAAIKSGFGIRKFFKEKKGFTFDPEVVSGKKEIFLWGFWQSPKYFDGIEDELREAFRFVHPLDGAAVQIAEDIKRKNSVSLHVRRTDYVAPKYQKMYGETNLDYYRRAIDTIAATVDNPTFYIFSDDIAWCKENIKPAFPVEYVERNSQGPKASHHLQLMSLCKHNIIANSTFSWWGAWLNRNPEKIVIAPKEWLAGQAQGMALTRGWETV